MSDDQDRRNAELRERSRQRRERMVVNRAHSYEEAERWDLEFWQRQTPQDRLSALAAIHREVELIEAARSNASKKKTDS